MTTTKMTYVNAINHAIESLSGKSVDEATTTQAIEKLIALGQQLEKRNSAKSGKPTKTQQANATVKSQIVEVLQNSNKPLQCGAIASAVGISGQKCSALLSQLCDSGNVEKIEGAKVEGVKGKVSLFTLPGRGE